MFKQNNRYGFRVVLNAVVVGLIFGGVALAAGEKPPTSGETPIAVRSATAGVASWRYELVSGAEVRHLELRQVGVLRSASVAAEDGQVLAVAYGLTESQDGKSKPAAWIVEHTGDASLSMDQLTRRLLEKSFVESLDIPGAGKQTWSGSEFVQFLPSSGNPRKIYKGTSADDPDASRQCRGSFGCFDSLCAACSRAMCRLVGCFATFGACDDEMAEVLAVCGAMG